MRAPIARLAVAAGAGDDRNAFTEGPFHHGFLYKGIGDQGKSDVLNGIAYRGIAYHAEGHRRFAAGQPRVLAIKLVKRTGAQ
jgi:hypothetical protein